MVFVSKYLMNKQKIKFFFLLILLHTPSHECQLLSAQPTPIPGSNFTVYQGQKYKFFHNDTLCYEYSILPGSTPNGGTFNVLRAYSDDESSFLPSNYGGIRAFIHNEEVAPWNSGVSFFCVNHKQLSDKSVVAHWQMNFAGDSIRYKYKFKIVGRTLIINIEVDSLFSNKVMSLELDRCEEGQNPIAIAVPYLSIFHILFSNNIFTSFFADWEKSNSSQIIAMNGSRYEYNRNSVRYAQIIKYNIKTDNSRNRMLETLYLTTSKNIEEVFPNIPNPESPYKDMSANLMVWDYRRPFARLIRKSGSSWNYLERIWNAGIKNLWVQIHDWQQYHGNPWFGLKSGYDDGLPCVLPANNIDQIGSEYGGKPVLDSILFVADKYGYRIGLHQNYVDFYTNAVCSLYGYNESVVAIDSDGKKIKTHYHRYSDTTGIQSYLLKPSQAPNYATYWSESIKKEYPGLKGAYLDVHSGIGPAANYVDYNTSTRNAGMFRETIKNYREIYSILRRNFNGPIQGEGGNMCLFLGYVDDIEARLRTPNRIQPGYDFPLFVNFDLLKLRQKTMVHGVGWYPLWKGIKKPRATYSEVLSYIATELAYGHGAYLSDEFDINFEEVDFIQHAILKYKHVYSVQKEYANANPIKILYNDNGTLKTASQFIRDHPLTFSDIKSKNFMGQVKIIYDNGMIVCVNRHPYNDWTISVGDPGGWFNYHTTDSIDTGILWNTNFILPAMNGWVVYKPL